MYVSFIYISIVLYCFLHFPPNSMFSYISHHCMVIHHMYLLPITLILQMMGIQVAFNTLLPQTMINILLYALPHFMP